MPTLTTNAVIYRSGEPLTLTIAASYGLRRGRYGLTIEEVEVDEVLGADGDEMPLSEDEAAEVEWLAMVAAQREIDAPKRNKEHRDE